ncbi:MAG: diguanylate cyclase [Pseudomonadota bacterium]
MSISSSSEAKIKQLSKRLEQSIQTRQQLEHEYNRDLNEFVEFIVKLTYACQGMDHQLDTKLSKLRSQLNRNRSLDNLQPLIDETKTLIESHTLVTQRNLKQSSEQARLTMTYLQKQPLPKNLQPQLKSLAEQLELPHISLNHYTPILVQFLQLLINASESIGAADKPQRIPSDELLELLNHIDFDGLTGQTVQHVRLKLAQPVSAEQFMQLVLELIKQIFSSINDERQSAQNFLLELNQTLSLVQGALNQTVSQRGEYQQRSGAINQQLQVNIKQLSESVSDATQLTELKQLVNSHMQSINTALRQKMSLESDERRGFDQQFDKVSKRLQQLERQVHFYKTELAEQKFKSLQDALTKLPNRAAFEERLELEFGRWKRYKEPLCIAVADIDYFKRINDNFGHTAGDKTLQVLASMLRKSVKQSDFVCRYGGEEFVIIFPQTELEQALQRLENVRDKICNIPFKFKNDDIRITVSIGIAQFKHDNDTLTSVFEAADKALYEAKKRGRDQVVSAQ